MTLSLHSMVTLPDWALFAAVGMVALGIALIGMLLTPKKRNTSDLSLEDRLSLYGANQASEHPARSGKGNGEDPFAATKAAAEAMLKRNESMEEKIAKRLESAGSEMRANEWLLLHVGIVVAAGFLGLLIGGGNIFVGVLFLGVGALLPWMFLGFKRNKRKKSFQSQLPDTLQLMSGSLSAGLSLQQSVDTIVNEGTEPMAGEFRKVLVETRLGVPLEDAMEGVVQRFDSKDFGWVVMAIRIQRQVGGNLGELLDTVAGTIREREYLRRQVATLSAEGKLSAYILGGLPPLFALYLVLTRPEYILPMFGDPRGIVILGAGVVMLSIGAFWMSRIVKVEV